MCVDNLKLTDRRDSDNNIIDNWIISNETRGENMSVRDTSIDPRLLDSARKEFMERGFLKAELKRICDNAGVTTGAVYKRYKGKEELFCAVVQDAVDVIEEHIFTRMDLDLAPLSDDEMHDMWDMTPKNVVEMFDILWDVREDLILLLDKASGTVYENYINEFSRRMTDSYYRYYQETKKRGRATAKITKPEMHVLCTAFWNAIYEPFVHGMSRKEIEEHCKIMCTFFDWPGVVGLK